MFGPNQVHQQQTQAVAQAPQRWPNPTTGLSPSVGAGSSLSPFEMCLHHHVPQLSPSVSCNLLHPSTSSFSSCVPCHLLPSRIHFFSFFSLTSFPHEGRFSRKPPWWFAHPISTSFLLFLSRSFPIDINSLTRDLLPSTWCLLLTASSPGLLTNLANLPTASCMVVSSTPAPCDGRVLEASFQVCSTPSQSANCCQTLSIS